MYVRQGISLMNVFVSIVECMVSVFKRKRTDTSSVDRSPGNPCSSNSVG